ncbi:membrane protein insertase YidC [Jiangella aurantiaca]|uniref:Membrane protein insertase YidC n=1 Tax=Jiangella aurantiaca TaxID=2530373 RepID=A0A4R5ABA5_9ACTN|nr:membrane protein insertase YidC [Jiangella aurantiaca]TDD69633.1 membrane protein insertase YidC [Jiangella aurantiaca]
MLSVLDTPARAVSELVLALSSAAEPLAGDAATGVAILLVVVLVRLLLLPLSLRAARAGRDRLALRPAELRLRERFRRDPVRLRRELAALHRSHGTSPFAGLGASLAQLPFFMVLYRLFSSPTLHGGANALFTHTLLGVPLSDRWLAAAGSGMLPAELLVFGAVFVLLLLVAWWSSRLAQRQATLGESPSSEAEVVMARVARVLPYGTVAVAAFVPLAAGLYLLFSGAWTTTERWLLNRDRPLPATA